MKKTIGGRIREIREQKGFTQEFIAQQLNISRQKLARIEKGQNDISFDLIVKIADILGVSSSSITFVVEQQTVEVFRTGGNASTSFSEIEEIIDMFFANKSLYNRMILEDDNG
ncbi:MAG: helix-turn-helix transcriptional regulator [Clostridia bacterium]|nr:helix-turn-helix transcriptional regulator [Clostridia bacterium]